MADREKLAAALTVLQAELASLDEVDAEVEQQLKAALSDIQARLDRDAAEEAAVEDDDSPADSLRSAMEHFEGSHPTLSGMISSVIDTLARMGI